MLTIEDVLSEENQQSALSELRLRRDTVGPDGMRLSELDEWHKANSDKLAKSILEGTYRPGIAMCFEVVTRSGKRREVVSINVVDRFVEKLLQLKLSQHLNPLFQQCSFAYQESKSALDAAILARDYIEAGNPYVCEIDLKDYFAHIDLDRMLSLTREQISDEPFIKLLALFLHRDVQRNGRFERQTLGLLQGASTSPVLSNLYLSDFDNLLDEEGYKWLRFSDNICVYTQTIEEASTAYSYLTDLLEWEHAVVVNERKSGVFLAIERRLLGYDIVDTGATLEVRRHTYLPVRRHDRWHASSIYKNQESYHILQDGIITRKDYSLLFENDEERHHIPVEVTSQINVYSEVTISPSALATLTEHDIRIAYVDRFGDLMGTFVPAQHGKAADIFLRQCALYTNKDKRLIVAKALEDAGIHNMRANLRYYAKRGRGGMGGHIEFLGECLKEIDLSKDIDSLRLVEARARKRYYSAFAEILVGTDFDFTKRTRRPPKDPGNAMVSFGNTVLYNAVLQAIWKTSLDPKIGVVHATNRRSYSLNLDIADLFKPIIVDRVIFSLVNKHMIRADEHFERCGEDAVLLTREGKRLFLDTMETKLNDTVTYRGMRMTYRRLISNEVARFQRLVATGERYRPYKYY